MRSESWTFIWQPKVLMHAVLPMAGARASGFLPRRTGTDRRASPAAASQAAFFASSVVLLILFLRLVDAGPQDDLAGAFLDLAPRQVQVARPRRRAQHGRDLREVFGPQREYRPSGPA